MRLSVFPLQMWTYPKARVPKRGRTHTHKHINVSVCAQILEEFDKIFFFNIYSLVIRSLK